MASPFVSFADAPGNYRDWVTTLPGKDADILSNATDSTRPHIERLVKAFYGTLIDMIDAPLEDLRNVMAQYKYARFTMEFETKEQSDMFDTNREYSQPFQSFENCVLTEYDDHFQNIYNIIIRCFFGCKGHPITDVWHVIQDWLEARQLQLRDTRTSLLCRDTQPAISGFEITAQEHYVIGAIPVNDDVPDRKDAQLLCISSVDDSSHYYDMLAQHFAVNWFYKTAAGRFLAPTDFEYFSPSTLTEPRLTRQLAEKDKRIAEYASLLQDNAKQLDACNAKCDNLAKVNKGLGETEKHLESIISSLVSNHKKANAENVEIQGLKRTNEQLVQIIANLSSTLKAGGISMPAAKRQRTEPICHT